jgi:hypothetical protein
MKKRSLLLLAFLYILLSPNVYSLENFWYKDIALDSVGQILPDTDVEVMVTIQDESGVLYQERFNAVRSDQFGIIVILVGTGQVVTGDLTDVNTNADTRIKIETLRGNVWVLSSLVNISEITRFLELDDIDEFAWSLTGNEGTNPNNNFLGTTDDVDLVFRINNIEAGRINRDSHNTLFGYEALQASTAANNTAIGYQALHDNTTGWSNTAVGNQALYSNTFRGNQVAIGDSALLNNGTHFSDTYPSWILDSAKAIRNTAVGSKALLNNTVGYWNTAVGYQAGYYNLYGKSMTAIGTEALMNNISGRNNTAVGTWTLYDNTHGSWNTGLGSGALKSNVTGDTNTVMGVSAMYYNNGNGNVAMGMFAAAFNSSGNGNVAIGTKSLFHNATGSYNTAIGYQAAQSYWYRNYHSSIFIGAFADGAFNGITNSIAIGNGVLLNGNNQIRLGGASHQTLYCQAIYNGTTTIQPNVVVDNGGRILRSTSLNRTFDDLTVNGNTILGTNSANTLTVNAQINSNLIPTGAIGLGTTTNRWTDLYVSGNSIHIGDNGDEGVIAYNTIDDYFDLNQDLHISKVDGKIISSAFLTPDYNVPTSGGVGMGETSGKGWFNITENGVPVVEIHESLDPTYYGMRVNEPGTGLQMAGIGWNALFDLWSVGVGDVPSGNYAAFTYATSTTPNEGRLVIQDGMSTVFYVDKEGDMTSASATVNGTSSLWGDVYLGINDANNIIANGEFVSHLIPDVTNQYDLGTDAKRWRNLYIAGLAKSATAPVAGEDLTNKTYVDGQVATAWSLSGNSGTTAGSNYIGTSDNQNLNIDVRTGVATVINSLRLTNNQAVYREFSGASASGNMRGNYSVDLQINRQNATEVASGNYAVISGGYSNSSTNQYSSVGGGYSNDATGDYSTIGGGFNNGASANYSVITGGRQNTATKQYSLVGGGYSNDATGDYSTVGGGNANDATGDYSTVGGGDNNMAANQYATVGGGRQNLANNDYALVSGGRQNTATGQYATILGGYRAIADNYGQNAYASGRFGANGDAQTSLFVVRNQTSGTSATWTNLYLNGTTVGAQQMTLRTNTSWAYKIIVIARTNSGTTGAWEIRGWINNSTNNSVVTPISSPAGWEVQIDATTSGILRVQVRNNSGTSATIRWVARVETSEVTF